MRRRVARLVLAIAVAGIPATAARSADPVTVGAICPPIGAAAENDARLALQTAADIVDTPHPGLETLPLGAGQGLPGLGGAKIAVTVADDLGNPSVAASEALQLIARNHVAALIGTGGSPEILAATVLAERHGMPFLVPDATAPGITARGFQWVFRTTPLGGDIANAYARFLTEVKTAGTKVDTVALVYPRTERGDAAAALLRDALKAAGFTIAADLRYTPDTAGPTALVAALRGANPDLVIAAGDAADAGLFVKAMKTLDYKPPLLIGDDSGFSDPGFVAANGNLAQGVIARSAWNRGKPGSPTAIVDNLFKAKSGHALDDASARILQGFFVLADAINRAGSTDPAAIRQALRAGDLKPDQLIVGYDGIKFDATGQNSLPGTYLTQLQGKQYVRVWPAAGAAAKLVLPFKAWE